MDDAELAQEARAPPVIRTVHCRERLPVTGLRFRVVALALMQHRQIIENAGDTEILRPKRLFQDRHTALVELLGFGVAVLCLPQQGQVVRATVAR